MNNASPIARFAFLVFAAAALFALAASPAVGASAKRSAAACSKRVQGTGSTPGSAERRAVRGCGDSVQRSARTSRSRDTTGPTVTWKAPLSGATVKGRIGGSACEVAASDAGGVERVVFKLDGKTLNSDSGAAWNCSFDSTVVADGSHTLSATAYDNARNARTASIAVLVANRVPTASASEPKPAPEPKPTPTPEPTPTPPADTTAPTVAWKAPVSGATVKGTIGGPNCEVAAGDDRGVSRVVFRVDGSTLNTETSAPWNCGFDSTAVAEGSHTLSATAYDAAGNARSAAVTVTVANAVAPAPAPTPAPEPTPTPTPTTPSGMSVGLDAGSWGATGVNEVSGAVDTVRYDTERGTAALAAYKQAGLKVQLLFPGPYNSGGVCALNAASWATSTLNYYKANTNPSASPVIEALNEPGGTWFWGPDAADAANGACYRNLLKETYKAFHAQYGSSAPKILGTLDGSGGLAFGRNWLSADWATYVDGFIVHPYGGTGSRSASALGNHALIESARALTGGRIYVTEVGWPTAVGQSATGDSLQWSEAEQATNITNFIAWCHGTGYVSEVVYFNYRDYGTNMWYGVLRSDGSRKPAYNALRDAAAKYGA